MRLTQREHRQSQTHAQCRHKIQRPMSLLLDQHTADQHWNQFAALEDDLRRIVQVAETRIGQTHSAQRQECQQSIGLQGNTSLVAGSFQFSLEIPKASVVGKLDKGQEPSVWLEAIQRKDQLLQIAIEQKEKEHTKTAKQELCGWIVVRQIQTEYSNFGR